MCCHSGHSWRSSHNYFPFFKVFRVKGGGTSLLVVRRDDWHEDNAVLNASKTHLAQCCLYFREIIIWSVGANFEYTTASFSSQFCNTVHRYISRFDVCLMHRMVVSTICYASAGLTCFSCMFRDWTWLFWHLIDAVINLGCSSIIAGWILWKRFHTCLRDCIDYIDRRCAA